MPQDFTDDKSTLVQVMAWCRQATSHYPNQCWLRSPTPYGVTRPQWVDILLCMCFDKCYPFVHDIVISTYISLSNQFQCFCLPASGCSLRPNQRCRISQETHLRMTMTGHGKAFLTTGAWCRESAGHWYPHKGPVIRRFDTFRCYCPEQIVWRRD